MVYLGSFLSLLLVSKIVTSDEESVNRMSTIGSDISTKTSTQSEAARRGKFLSVFKIVRFSNSECLGPSGEAGTCYSKKDCAAQGGSTLGICALGFGVCCVVSRGCGGQSVANNSYFNGPDTLGSKAGSCQFTILGDGSICQYRLNFERFNIAPPATPSEGLCLKDQFSVSGATTDVPTICGNNNDQHLIFNTNGRGNPVTLTVSGVTTFEPREWKIRIIKYACHCPYLAPQGCLQYFTGTTGTLKSFNFLPNYRGNKLALMSYSICIRNEADFCSICYSQCMNAAGGTFSISGTTRLDPMNNRMPGVGVNKRCSADYLVIPCGGAMAQPSCGTDRFCGGALSSTDVVGLSPSMTVCTVQRPFKVSFYTDNMDEAGTVNAAGFCLDYAQSPCFT